MAELRVADVLADGPRRAEELGPQLGVDGLALRRVMRLVASYGFFTEDGEGRFALTADGERLRPAANALYPRLRLAWQDVLLASYRALPEALETGRTAFDLAFGKPLFDVLAEDRYLGAIFDASMARFSEHENAAIAETFPFGGFRRVMDVGGGQGGLLAAVLARHPDVEGILFDAPAVAASPAQLAGVVPPARWSTTGGNFIHEIPAGADLYVLKRIIHDWPDADARRILDALRRALGPAGRALVIDAVMRPGDAPDPNKFMDVNIMALTPGRERTEAEFRALLAGAGLRLQAIHAVPAPATVSMLEIVPA